jgi:1-acyl-sn-glycerol-3-phosphate acyltransferase
MFYWLMKYIVIGPLLKAIFRPWIVGRRNVPAEGAAILASNHLSFIDSVFLPLMIDRPMSFLAKSDYFTGKGLKGWATRMFMKGTGQIPIDRTGGKASEASLNTGLQVLGRGDLLGIYPEGTRSPDGRLYRGRTGLARMALEAHVPVIPVVMVDTDTVMPIGRRIPRVGRVGMVIGEPLDFSRFAGMEGVRYILRSVTDEIMVALQRLGEQTYDDVYASTVKNRLPASPAD